LIEISRWGMNEIPGGEENGRQLRRLTIFLYVLNEHMDNLANLALVVGRDRPTSKIPRVPEVEAKDGSSQDFD
jgi:hypothetical protein